MGKDEVIVYKALDFLFCRPDKPIYEPLIKDGKDIGYRMVNLISVCNQHSFVTAIPNPQNNYSLLVFGKYPIQKFLLTSVGKLKIKQT